MLSAYCPKRGEVVWLKFSPQAGHEQAGFRPALTLTPENYNRKTGLAVFCPITSQVKGYPFEVLIPSGLKISGVILSDQIRNLDWQVRGSKFFCKVPESTFLEVLNKLGSLLNFNF